MKNLFNQSNQLKQKSKPVFRYMKSLFNQPNQGSTPKLRYKLKSSNYAHLYLENHELVEQDILKTMMALTKISDKDDFYITRFLDYIGHILDTNAKLFNQLSISINRLTIDNKFLRFETRIRIILKISKGIND